MKIYQVDMRKGNTDYAYLTLYLFSVSKHQPTPSQINTFLYLIDEIDLNVLSIDEGLDIDNYDFGIDQINTINDKLVKSLHDNEVFYIVDAFNSTINIDNLLHKDGKVILIDTKGEARYF